MTKVASVLVDVYEGFGKGRLVTDPRHVSQILEERHLENTSNHTPVRRGGTIITACKYFTHSKARNIIIFDKYQPLFPYFLGLQSVQNLTVEIDRLL
jgi:hypothetical protein